MSAKLDRSQEIRFFFGNAARDLSDLLPEWGEESAIKIVPAAQAAEHIHASVDFSGSAVRINTEAVEHAAIAETFERCLELSEQLGQKQRLLGFLMADLKRMIG